MPSSAYLVFYWMDFNPHPDMDPDQEFYLNPDPNENKTFADNFLLKFF
jgi:hypothetical protein